MIEQSLIGQCLHLNLVLRRKFVATALAVAHWRLTRLIHLRGCVKQGCVASAYSMGGSGAVSEGDGVLARVCDSETIALSCASDSVPLAARFAIEC